MTLQYLDTTNLCKYCMEARRQTIVEFNYVIVEFIDMEKKVSAMMKKALHEELLRYHHKRKFYINIHEELLPVAWHPDRVYDWCFDEEEKGFLEEMWRS